MTPNHDFTNAKVGDKVYHVDGEGIIAEIRDHHTYPIVIALQGRHTCTYDGRSHELNTTPSFFTEPIKVVPASYEPFQEQEMMVWDDDDDIQIAHKRMVLAKHKGLFVAYSFGDLHDQSVAHFWQNALPIHEWEAKVKESKNQKEITEIEDQIAELQAKLEKLKG